MMLKLDNKDLMEDICNSITKKTSFELLDTILVFLKNELNISLKEIESEIFKVLTYELNLLYTIDIINNSSKKDIEKVNLFLEENYKEIFNLYYLKNKCVSQADFEDCEISVSINFSLTNEVAGILIGKWIEDNIINLSF